MSRHELLGQISGLQSMMRDIFNAADETDCYQSLAEGLPPLAWLFGRSVYAETYWVREVLVEDEDMTQRVRHLFANTVVVSDQVEQALPERENLLSWALELQDDNMMRLENPALLEKESLAPHPLLQNDYLWHLILQEYALRYEQMMANLNIINARKQQAYQVLKVLKSSRPSSRCIVLQGGHYRIGAKENPAALPSELPTQIVELSSFHMNKNAVSNSEWLGFIEADGYQQRHLWTDEGWDWCELNRQSPLYWRQDIKKQWYSIGLNGACDLVASSAVSGICQHEAMAYANWVAEHGGKLKNAAVQHEYQWETAQRAQKIKVSAPVREWCCNLKHRYTGYKKPAYKDQHDTEFKITAFSLRGTSLYTPEVFQRISYRQFANPDQRFMFTGTRLVFPATAMPWHL
ncbi:MAG: SUMF1/EgtB/PvdO family nonheme iron enzyme [Cocleimonas sp.]|nr:SUMF1/EgtB/PvdO family nonheme iron enzyme [Cocleimonas sp.]